MDHLSPRRQVGPRDMFVLWFQGSTVTQHLGIVLLHCLQSYFGEAMAGNKIAVVIGSNEPEKAWNAFRFANLALGKKDTIKVFLMNSGVECLVDKGKHDVKTLSEKFENGGGKLLACGTCIKNRSMGEVCSISTMETFYKLVMESDRAVYF